MKSHTPDALIRIRGDIIQELRCKEVLVTATTGYKRNQEFHRDYLPVYLGEEPAYIDTSRLITTNPIMDQVDCAELFPPIFQSITGQLVQATPKIQLVQVQLSKPEQNIRLERTNKDCLNHVWKLCKYHGTYTPNAETDNK